MTTPDVNVFLIDFPNSGREMVVPNEDDTYTILINAKLSRDEQLKAYEHAMKHIMRNDFAEQNVQAIEAAAHEIIQNQSMSKSIPSMEFEKEIRRLRRRAKRLREKIRRDEERVQFLIENCDVFAMSERNYLYGKDL